MFVLLLSDLGPESVAASILPDVSLLQDKVNHPGGEERTDLSKYYLRGACASTEKNQLLKVYCRQSFDCQAVTQHVLHLTFDV